MSVFGTIEDMIRGADRRLEKPVVLQFPVIDICNSACQMCHIWKNKKSATVQADELRQALKNPLFSEVRSVGLNGGEPTLRKDLALLASSLFDALPKLRDISLITNAYKVDWAIPRIAELADVVDDRGGRLDVMVSLDGFEEVHDAVRGKEGNFERAKEVIAALKVNPKVASIRIGCTIIKENVFGLHDLFDFCEREELYVKYRIGIPHKRLYTDDIQEPFALNNAEVVHITTFLEGLIAHYEPNARQRQFYKSLIGQLTHGAPRTSGCDWRHRGATISSTGEVLYCAVESDVVAKLGDADLESTYFGAESELDRIKRDKCATCIHDYVGLPDRRGQLGILSEEVRSRWGIESNPIVAAAKDVVGGARAKMRFDADDRRFAGFAQSVKTPAQLPGQDLICGWYGTETLGDKAILGGVIDGLRAADPAARIALVSLHPEISELTKEQMPEFADVQILTVEQALEQAESARSVIFGGGPLMGIRELLPMRRLFELAKEGGAKTVIAGCGVGPLGAARFHKVIGDILRLADVRVFRDEASRDRAAELGVDTRDDQVTEDPAASWVRSRRKNPSRDAGSLLLGLRKFPYGDYAPELGEQAATDLMERSDQAIADALVAATRANPDLVLKPLPMCANQYGADDRWYYRELLRRRPELVERVDWALLGREFTPEEYLAEFETATAAVAMRFHSLVFALNCAVPTLAIDYTMGRGKVSALAEQSGTPCTIYGEFSSESLASQIEKLLEPGLEALPDAPEATVFGDVFTPAMRELLKPNSALSS